MVITATAVFRSSILLVSTILITTSFIAFAVTGHANQLLATYCSSGNWTDEIIVVISSGLGFVAGVLGVLAAFKANLGTEEHNCRTNRFHTFYTVAMVFATVSLVVTVISTVLSAVKQAWLSNTCHEPSGTRDHSIRFKCTPELAACSILPMLGRRNEAERKWACNETRASRMLLIPLAVFSFLLVVLYIAQVYLARKRAIAARLPEVMRAHVKRYHD
ncbi:hypothetical protein EJ02DRAFT_516255 [Clathrospora elynae]|uniref:MARVEL domain-containing protein n=1 Tax=Clathrospora elynae TaxID=706981 RepID=A0A6A5S7I2_9PLEO|nr:hypothetical protein EJ02DRAFT_516255 [Clathrospora elynae]